MDNLRDLPNSEGFFGDYGGKFVPETLMFALKELEDTYDQLKSDPDFLKQIDQTINSGSQTKILTKHVLLPN